MRNIGFINLSLCRIKNRSKDKLSLNSDRYKKRRKETQKQTNRHIGRQANREQKCFCKKMSQKLL